MPVDSPQGSAVGIIQRPGTPCHSSSAARNPAARARATCPRCAFRPCIGRNRQQRWRRLRRPPATAGSRNRCRLPPTRRSPNRTVSPRSVRRFSGSSWPKNSAAARSLASSSRGNRPWLDGPSRSRSRYAIRANRSDSHASSTRTLCRFTRCMKQVRRSSSVCRFWVAAPSPISSACIAMNSRPAVPLPSTTMPPRRTRGLGFTEASLGLIDPD